MKIDVSALLKKAPNARVNSSVTAFSSGSNVYSVGIVNSHDNGKRVTISKGLSNKLDLTATLDVLPLPDDGVL